MSSENRQQLSDENLKKYLDYIEIKDISLEKPTIQLLNRLVFKHVSHIPYQNQTIFNQEKLNFDVKCIKAYPLNGKPYDPNAPSSHNILIVNIDKKLYLVDVGYGNNGIRFPVSFNYKETEVKEVFPGETYQLEVHKDYFQLNIKIKGDFVSMYRFNRPFEEIGQEETVKNMDKILDFKGMMPIRDLYLKISIITHEGRICFYSEPKNGINTCYMINEIFGDRNKKLYQNWDIFKSDVLKNTSIDISKTLNKYIK